ncbi:mushroom body large-type Kenyon cell-specific protein 1 isoform X3 [Cloeon dipterum]|uniref:mushroom body large-type Kenyon cell-specific protein 1 isoform X3 n=1 Tax=Cloeon dipterum TaxID=197152 RepID=UPI0032208D38
MAECSYSSCIQEKRAIKRELQKWTKDLVYLVGLERVAEELMGRRRWRQYQAHVLGAEAISKHETQTAWEKRSKEEIVKEEEEEELEAAAEAAAGAAAPEDLPKDWQPEDRCYFCDGAVHTEPCRSPQPSESSQSSMDSSPQPASVDLNAAVGLHPGSPAFSIESLNRMATSLAAMASMAGNPAAVMAAAAAASGTGPGINPLLAAAPGFFPWYLSQALAKQQQQHQHQQQQQHQQVSPAATPSGTGGEQPLDLSAKPSSKSDSPLDSPTSLKMPGLDVKPIFRSTVAGRRTYTEEELQAALRDIQSGKLGTRRAAVIYGIPRSTLRNKVYKLERERERDHLLMQSTPPPPASTSTPAAAADDNSGDEDGSKTLSMEELVRFSGLDNLPATDSLRQLLQSSSGGSKSSSAAPPAAPPSAFPEPPAALAPYLSQLLGAASAEQQSGLVELMKRIGGAAAAENNNNASGSGAEATSEEETTPNSLLRIPSFKPNGNEASEPRGSGSSSPSLGVSLRDVITKSITQKFQSSTPSISVVDPATLMANPLKRMSSDPGGDRFLPHHQKPHHSQHQQHHHQSHHHQQQQQAGSGGDSKNKGGKGTRPKRGKYRNYDRDSLIEAVRAVQRGEMSVHRAGSYYGVPHSTLEYKVKERHLMRPRKRDLNKASSSGGLPEDKAKIGPPRGPLPKPPPGGAGGFPNLAAMAGLANGLGGKGLFGPGPPPLASAAGPYHQFWPGAANPFMINPELYQEQLLASHMMQRKAATDPVADRFFDGLIRNSLERPAAGGEAAGLANRALLEQLCRGRPPAAAATAAEQTVVDLSQEDERPAADSDDESVKAADDCDRREEEDAADGQGTSSTAPRNSTD